jgi:hypothetical protein
MSEAISDPELEALDKILGPLRFSLFGKWAKLAIEEDARR